MCWIIPEIQQFENLSIEVISWIIYLFVILEVSQYHRGLCNILKIMWRKIIWNIKVCIDSLYQVNCSPWAKSFCSDFSSTLYLFLPNLLHISNENTFCRILIFFEKILKKKEFMMGKTIYKGSQKSHFIFVRYFPFHI